MAPLRSRKVHWFDQGAKRSICGYWPVSEFDKVGPYPTQYSRGCEQCHLRLGAREKMIHIHHVSPDGTLHTAHSLPCRPTSSECKWPIVPSWPTLGSSHCDWCRRFDQKLEDDRRRAR